MSNLTSNEKTDPREWLIRKRGYYYRPNRAGYTASVDEAGRYTETEAKTEAAIEPWHMAAVHQSAVEPIHSFKNFHRQLCERFGYAHDEVDWQRDQVSLIEHIAKRLSGDGSQVGTPKPSNERLLAKVRTAVQYAENGDPIKDAIDDDEIIDALRLLASSPDETPKPSNERCRHDMPASICGRCDEIRPLETEIERLRIEVDKYDSSIAQRDLQIEQLQKDLRSSHAAYNSMLDKAAELERKLSGDGSAGETRVRPASDIRCRHSKYLTEPCVACEQLSSEGGERIICLGEDGVLTRLTYDPSSEETSINLDKELRKRDLALKAPAKPTGLECGDCGSHSIIEVEIDQSEEASALRPRYSCGMQGCPGDHPDLASFCAAGDSDK